MAFSVSFLHFLMDPLAFLTSLLHIPHLHYFQLNVYIQTSDCFLPSAARNFLNDPMRAYLCR